MFIRSIFFISASIIFRHLFRHHLDIFFRTRTNSTSSSTTYTVETITERERRDNEIDQDIQNRLENLGRRESKNDQIVPRNFSPFEIIDSTEVQVTPEVDEIDDCERTEEPKICENLDQAENDECNEIIDQTENSIQNLDDDNFDKNVQVEITEHIENYENSKNTLKIQEVDQFENSEENDNTAEIKNEQIEITEQTENANQSEDIQKISILNDEFAKVEQSETNQKVEKNDKMENTDPTLKNRERISDNEESGTPQVEVLVHEPSLVSEIVANSNEYRLISHNADNESKIKISDVGEVSTEDIKQAPVVEDDLVLSTHRPENDTASIASFHEIEREVKIDSIEEIFENQDTSSVSIHLGSDSSDKTLMSMNLGDERPLSGLSRNSRKGSYN